jgi:hypothetical protein
MFKEVKKLLKIRQILKMEKLEVFVVMVISFLLIFIQTAGSFYCKSLSGFSYAGLIIIDTFLLIKKLVFNNKSNGLKKAKLVSIILNIGVLIVLSITVVLKCLSVITTNQINVDVIIITTWFTSITLFVCSLRYKKFMYTRIFSIFNGI